MSTRQQLEDRKQPPKPPPPTRTAEPAEDQRQQLQHEERERPGEDPSADENPCICRGID